MKKLSRRLLQLWMAFGALLHRIMSPIQLAIVFFLILSPFGIVLRLFKFDPLKLKPDPKLQTYWVESERRNDPPDQMKFQF